MKVKTKYKKCRRLGSPIYEKCRTAKFALSEQRRTPVRRRGMISDYAKQLMEKQKLRLSYGLKEKKLKSYILDSISSKNETFSEIYKKLETRLDNVVFKLGLASTRAMARQMVSHGHIMVNGIKLNIPSHALKVGDQVSVREQSKDRKSYENINDKNIVKAPKWLTFDVKALSGKVESNPEMDNIDEFNYRQIIEFYTR